MATAAANKKPAPEAANTPAEEATKRSFSFEPTFDMPAPASIPVVRANALPFKDYFTSVEAAAAEGKQPHLFLPAAFWIEERGVAAEKVTSGYQKGKVREQFNQWRDQTAEEGKENPREKLTLLMIDRKGTEEGFSEAGLSIWLTLAK